MMRPFALLCVVNRRRRRLELARRADARVVAATGRLATGAVVVHRLRCAVQVARTAAEVRRLGWLLARQRARLGRIEEHRRTQRELAAEHRAVACELAAVMVDAYGGGWECDKPHAQEGR